MDAILQAWFLGWIDIKVDLVTLIEVNEIISYDIIDLFQPHIYPLTIMPTHLQLMSALVLG